jgi:hypothetical protein
MGIYLGQSGNIELTRKSLDGSKESIVNPSDVNVTRKRFSFDFDEGFLITGDLVELTTTDGTPLDFISAAGWANGIVQSSGNWYVFIDELGGIKLYTTFSGSLDGGPEDVVPLADIARDIPITVSIRDRDSRILGQITEYELNTNRETVDVTVLSDEHRQQYSSLISGSGQLTAQWDYATATDTEPVNYLLQLILRTEVGATFRGKFYVKTPYAIPQAGSYQTSQANDSLWWEFDAVVTSAAMGFSAGEVVDATISFVTTGPVRLRASTQAKRFVLQETGSKLELEQTSGALLLEEPE